MKKAVLILLLAQSAMALPVAETWSVDGKTFGSKALAVRYVISSGKRLEVMHSRCEILTKKLTFKACPKNKAGSWENEQYVGPISEEPKGDK